MTQVADASSNAGTWRKDKLDMANRLFFRLYQCANMLHKTGSKAVEAEHLTTQQWAVLGALSRPAAKEGMSVGDLARYLMVSRQNLSGVLGRMEKQGYLQIQPSGADKRSRLITTSAAGAKVWEELAQPKISRYYEQALEGFSTDDMTHALHYLLKMLENMRRIDNETQPDCADAVEMAFADEME
jgi:DNA-binding MarR family transcriptional regulator